MNAPILEPSAKSKLCLVFFQRMHVVSWLLWEMDKVVRIQIMDEAVCIPVCANTLGKSMNLSLLPPTIGE